MSEYLKRQNITKEVYCVSARPIGFWRRRMEWLPYNVGQKVQLEVTIESRRERGIAWMDCTYFNFIETMPDGTLRTIEVDENKIIIDKRNKQKGFFYPVVSQMRNITQAGHVGYKLVDKINHEEAVLFTDETVFLHSSKNIIVYIFSMLSFIFGIASTLLIQ
jgi:hypothetical protein